jgi:hypothetical protein
MPMKKFFLFGIGLVLSLAAGMSVSRALVPNEDDLLQQIFEEAGIEMSEKTDAKELENLAANSEAPFSGLYLFMLQNIVQGPRDAAAVEIAERFKYTEDEIKNIVLEGSVEPIIDKQRGEASAVQSQEVVDQMTAAVTQGDADFETFLSSNSFSPVTESYLRWHYQTYERPPLPSEIGTVLSNDFVLKEFTAIGDAYDDELQFQEDNRRLAYETLASEMFFNNDLGDSANIDILYDLDLIHYLLFGDFITYPDRSGGSVDLASEEALQLFPEPSAEGSEEEAVVVLAEEPAEAPFNPYACYADEGLTEALDSFATNPPDLGSALPEPENSFNYEIPGRDGTGGEDGSGGSAGTLDGATDGEAGGSGGSGGTENPYAVDIGAAFEALDAFLLSLEMKPGDWMRTLPCSGVFCIEIKFIPETNDPEVDTERMQADDFEPTENCVACHTAYIKERLTETMSKSLVPSKITKNWFEDATCKDAGYHINLDLNVYAIKKPIDLDTGDTLDDKAGEEIDEFKTQLFGIAGIPLPDGSGGILGKSKSESECESLLNIGKMVGTERKIDELLGSCQKAADSNVAELQEVFDEFVYNIHSQTTSDLFSQVSSELYSMLLYFQNFQGSLEATYLTEQAPLSVLINKEYCQ